jgi:hypothetical protein
MRSALRLSFAMLALSLLGCGAEAPVPDKPTWADDVLPILRANCFHCHGPVAHAVKYGSTRWDVYDLVMPSPDPMHPIVPTETAMTFADLGFSQTNDPDDPMNNAVLFTGAKHHAAIISLEVSLPVDDPAHMPPAPATPLSARDVQVLANWAKPNAAALGKRNPNSKPTIHWLQRPKTFEVLDGDGDQVLGQLDCVGKMVPINHSGTSSLSSGASPPCSARLYDGFDLVTANLK